MGGFPWKKEVSFLSYRDIKEKQSILVDYLEML